MPRDLGKLANLKWCHVVVQSIPHCVGNGNVIYNRDAFSNERMVRENSKKVAFKEKKMLHSAK